MPAWHRGCQFDGLGLFQDGDAIEGWCHWWDKHFWFGIISLRVFVMAVELLVIELFAITMAVFDFILLVGRALCCHFAFVELAVGKLFANDGSIGKHSWCVGAWGVACCVYNSVLEVIMLVLWTPFERSGGPFELWQASPFERAGCLVV